MARLYQYVGPEEIRLRSAQSPTGRAIESASNLRQWLRITEQRPNRDGLIPLTFVVDEHGILRVADRGSEHIACSGGLPVLSAGEMFFSDEDTAIKLIEVSNQSTGFCPEPESWPVVASALDRVGIAHPGYFTAAITFRRCPACGQRNIVKDGWFVCDVCDAELPAVWNF